MKLNCHCGAIEAEIKATVNELVKIVKFSPMSTFMITVWLEIIA